ncbi:maleylpyruvate isomerase N-terminal domain-containing protein [Streptomyces sp. NPDC001595]|uniref:maleylpyruvate isomerase N-terminal domain-containing protein n=1 Tax=Streptomyces sp. NPDC001532 TaxID=3154520 RepID=UPI00332A5A6C
MSPPPCRPARTGRWSCWCARGPRSTSTGRSKSTGARSRAAPDRRPPATRPRWTPAAPRARRRSSPRCAALRRAAPRCAAPRCAALREAGPDAGVWGWAGIPDAGFRARRTTHEITVHRADAALAAGLPYEVAPEVAADAVDEWLEIVRFVQRSARDEAAAEPRGPGRGIHLHATDAGPGLNAGWLIERRGARGAGGTGGAGAAGVLAPAGDVRLNRRFTADGPPPSVVRGTGRVCGR